MKSNHSDSNVKVQGRCLGRLLRLERAERRSAGIWEDLLSRHPETWREVLRWHGIDPEGGGDSGTDDDPVPQAVLDVLWHFDATRVYEAVREIPFRESKHFELNLAAARREIEEAIKEIWGVCLHNLHFKLPLLIMDEAHHLKNAETRLASLFQVPDAREDAEEISKGPLGGIFQRMLFLTATPFQLGHHELCSVLERFGGILWKHPRAPRMGKEGFHEKLRGLREKLDAAQEAALTLDAVWGQLRQEDLVLGQEQCVNVEEWWKRLPGEALRNSRSVAVLSAYERTQSRMAEAEEAIRPWVIRHLKPKFLSDRHAGKPRRQHLVGKTIVDDSQNREEFGIPITGPCTLPFLLAARAVACAPDVRPLFAEGLASSYEAFLHTRRNRRRDDSPLDHDDLADENDIAVNHWYLDQLTKALPLNNDRSSATHPKIAATCNRVLDAWRQGEKVVVFCHFIATGLTLRRVISGMMRDEILQRGAKRLKIPMSQMRRELERLGKRFFDSDSPVRVACDAEVRALLKSYPDLSEYRESLVEVVRRNVRTPSSLVRYFPLHHARFGRGSVEEAFSQNDASGLSLRQTLQSFFEFLQVRCGSEDRRRIIDAVSHLQTGSILSREVDQTFSSDERQGDSFNQLRLPNVRLVNGATDQETRQRLMLAFNTPFFPEVLVASSVMAEGVDLHRYCRYVIHHDLCWNPSTLEQRTGRIDRIGAKVELCGEPIRIYLPFVAETQDEKMFRVVIDRERWFKVVMGEEFKVDARTTEKLANRIPLPAALAEQLAFRLEVVRVGLA